MRTFIAIEIDEPLRARIAEQLLQLQKLAPDARWVRPDRLHLTLAFLGEVADASVPALTQALGELAQRHRPLHLAVSGAGVFGSLERPRVLWVALTGDLEPLGLLYADLTRALALLGQAPDHERFEPHVTLARSRNPRGDPGLARCSDVLRGTALGLLEARELVLFASQPGRDGMNHLAVSRHALTAAHP